MFVFRFSDNAGCRGQEAVDSIVGCGVEVDVEHILSSPTSFMTYLEHLECTEEDADELDRVVSMPDGDTSADSITKQRKHHSAALLKKEQKQSRFSSAVFIKVVGTALIVSSVVGAVLAWLSVWSEVQTCI